MVAECLEARARLRVRRRKLGVFATVSGVGEAWEMGEDRKEGRGEEGRGFGGVVGREDLGGGECGSG